MILKNMSDDKLLSPKEVIRRLESSLIERRPFSLVRAGDGVNIVMGQYDFLSEEEFLRSGYYTKTSYGDKTKGVTLPSVILRDQTIESIKKADIVGICRQKDDEVQAPERFKRPLTDLIFEKHDINPPALCDVFVNRRMVSEKSFWELLHRHRTLLISKWAGEFAAISRKRYPALKPNIVGTLDFTHYDQISKTLKSIGQFEFDLLLISAGVNAVIMAPQVAWIYGKVAVDFGKAMMFFVKSSDRIHPWLPG